MKETQFVFRFRLRRAARLIASNHGVAPTSKLGALRKLVLQERRDRTRPGSPIVGWKRGELFEVLAANQRMELEEELGDVGYYVAQSFDWAWAIYTALVPKSIIERAVEKFERRARS